MTTARGREARKTSGSRGVKVACGVAAVVAAAGIVWSFADGGPAPAKFHGAALPLDDATEAPPDFEVPPTEELRIQLLIEMLMTADQDDALWARDRLLEAGPEARRRITEIAQRCLESNTAFVQHALDVVRAGPLPGDAQLAMEGLASRDPHVVTRSADILGFLGSAAPPEAVPAIAKAARLGYPIAHHACSALARIGGTAADAALSEIAADEHADPTPRQQALVALGAMEGATSLATMRRIFETATDRQIRIAAAQGLIQRRDPAPLEWLRAEFAASQDAQALSLLSDAADEVAYAEIERRLTGALEDHGRRTSALLMLQRFPAARKEALLRKVASDTDSDELRADAWEAIARDCGGEAEVAALLTSNAEPARRARERYAAALVIGRLRKPAFGKALLATLPPKTEPSLRIVTLRAVVLCEAEEGAETVIREIAEDPSGYDAAESPSLNLSTQMRDASRAFRRAAGPFVLKALRGEYGVPGPRAQMDLIHLAGLCCGQEASPLVEPFLTHPERQYREAAARVLPVLAGPDAIRGLRAAWWKPQDAYTRSELHVALRRAALARPVVAGSRPR